MAAVDDSREAAREVIRQMGIGEHWESAIEPGMPPALMEFTMGTLRAYEHADLDWLLAISHPGLVISQPAEFPDARSYSGENAVVDALLDWPRQWKDFRLEPRRIFAAGDEDLVLVAVHRGRPHFVDLEVEAEITFLLRLDDGLVTRWDMFLTVDEALRRAAEGGAHGDDDHAAERHGRERP
jgi:ketosteroid isomerase-like protein